MIISNNKFNSYNEGLFKNPNKDKFKEEVITVIEALQNKFRSSNIYFTSSVKDEDPPLFSKQKLLREIFDKDQYCFEIDNINSSPKVVIKDMESILFKLGYWEYDRPDLKKPWNQIVYKKIDNTIDNKYTLSYWAKTHNDRILGTIAFEKDYYRTVSTKNENRIRGEDFMNGDLYSKYLEGEFEPEVDMAPEEYFTPERFGTDNSIFTGSDFNKLDPGEIPYNSVFDKIVNTNMDICDKDTRCIIANLTEAGQNTVLTALTNRLYDIIVKKSNEIDYGFIPKSAGDISKLANYNSLIETMELLHKIVDQYKQKTDCVDAVSVAIDNIRNRKDLFERGFRYDLEFVMMVYCNAVYGVLVAVSHMISTCIEFVKSPKQDDFDIVLDQMAYTKNKDHMIYGILLKFNKSCKSGDLDKALTHIIDSKAQKFTGAGLIAGIAITALIISNIIPILREMVFLFYYIKTNISSFCNIQSDLLEMNMYNLQHNDTIIEEEKKAIIEKQSKISQFFRNMSNKFNIDMKEADVRSSKESNTVEKKLKMSDLEQEDPMTSTSLF